MKSYLVIILLALCVSLNAQTPAYDELEFEQDSITAVYKPSGKNSVLVRSKRGSGGLNTTALADAIKSAEVTEIVLVYTEMDAADLAEREEATQERWENLLKTYPEFFQFSTTYKNLCQCNSRGDGESFKQAQGFYIYIAGDVPKVAETKAEEPKVASTPPPAPAKKIEEKKVETKGEAAPVAVTTAGKVAEPVKEVAKETAPEKTEIKAPEAAPAKEKEPVKENREAATKAAEPEKPAVAAAPAREPAKKKPGVAKSRKTKDPKACRMACYENGDESLDAFFKDNLKLSKKDRRKAKKLVPVVKLQLNVDGTIKKVLVTCPDEKLNVMITEAVKSMNPWNASIKNGVTIKSEAKITLKFDKKAKTFKPFEVAITPRLAPKCKCAGDSEMFD